mgnify:CR=1 FL=1
MSTKRTFWLDPQLEESVKEHLAEMNKEDPQAKWSDAVRALVRLGSKAARKMRARRSVGATHDNDSQ